MSSSAMRTASPSPSPERPYLYHDPKLHTDYTSDYDPQEPEFDDEEPEFNPQDPDDPEHATSTTAQTPAAGGGTDDPDAQVPLTNGAQTPGRHIVEVNTGDGGPKKAAVIGLREKRIEDEKRSTTPYMTKYERARVLGTRALQIR